MTDKMIESIFKKYGGIMRTKELQKNGIHYRILKKLINEGTIEKIRYGYYQWQDEKAFSEAAIISSLFPEGVLCMETALLYYDYTDRVPTAWHIAVDNRTGRTKFRIDYPEVKPHYIIPDRWKIGIAEGEIDGVSVRIYDRERIICDCLRYINRMDGEIFNIAIKRYVSDPQKNIARLMQYAKLLGVETKVRRTVGIWL